MTKKIQPDSNKLVLEELREEIREADGMAVRPLRAGEMIEYGDFVEISPPPNFVAKQLAVYGRKVLPSEERDKKFWRAIQ